MGSIPCGCISRVEYKSPLTMARVLAVSVRLWVPEVPKDAAGSEQGEVSLLLRRQRHQLAGAPEDV